jgi:hypothetical protein
MSAVELKHSAAAVLSREKLAGNGPVWGVFRKTEMRSEWGALGVLTIAPARHRPGAPPHH